MCLFVLLVFVMYLLFGFCLLGWLLVELGLLLIWVFVCCLSLLILIVFVLSLMVCFFRLFLGVLCVCLWFDLLVFGNCECCWWFVD